MYRNCHIHLKIRKNLERIPYKTGVQQGDNMILIFLFVMQAVIETLNKDLLSNNNKPEFRYFLNEKKDAT